MVKTQWISDGVDKITAPGETAIRVIKSVGIKELRILNEIKARVPKDNIFHVTLESDSATLGQARSLLDELSSELDLHPVVLNVAVSPATNYGYLEQIIKESDFEKVVLSHSIREPNATDLANFIIKMRDTILLGWQEFAYGSVADKVAEAEKFIFDNEVRRVRDLKSTEYRTFLVKWHETIKKDLRNIKERLNKLEGGK